jgi:large subunit ribosomal protein L30
MATTGGSKQMAGSKKMKVTLVRSVINTRESHRATVRGLGLRHLNHTVEIEDTPATRGMVRKVAYLVKCED